MRLLLLLLAALAAVGGDAALLLRASFDAPGRPHPSDSAVLDDACAPLRHGDIFYSSAPYNLTGRIVKYVFAEMGPWCTVADGQPVDIRPNVALFDFDEALAAGCASYRDVIARNHLVVSPGLYLFTQTAYANSLPGFADFMGDPAYFTAKLYPVTTLHPDDQDDLLALVNSAGPEGLLVSVANDPGEFVHSVRSAPFVSLRIAHFLLYGAAAIVCVVFTARALVTRPRARRWMHSHTLRVLVVLFCLLRITEAVDMLGYANIFGLGVCVAMWWAGYIVGFLLVAVFVLRWMQVISRVQKGIDDRRPATASSSSLAFALDSQIALTAPHATTGSDRSHSSIASLLPLHRLSFVVVRALMTLCLISFIAGTPFFVVFFVRRVLDDVAHMRTVWLYVLGSCLAAYCMVASALAATVLYGLRFIGIDGTPAHIRPLTRTVLACVLLLLLVVFVNAIRESLLHTPMTVIGIGWLDLAATLSIVGLVIAAIERDLVNPGPMLSGPAASSHLNLPGQRVSRAMSTSGFRFAIVAPPTPAGAPRRSLTTRTIELQPLA